MLGEAEVSWGFWFFITLCSFLARTIDNKDKTSQVLKQSVFMHCMIQNDKAVLHIFRKKRIWKDKWNLHLYRQLCIANLRFWQFPYRHLKIGNLKGNLDRSLTIALLPGVSMRSIIRKLIKRYKQLKW